MMQSKIVENFLHFLQGALSARAVLNQMIIMLKEMYDFFSIRQVRQKDKWSGPDDNICTLRACQARR